MASVHFLDFCAIDDDFIYLAANLDDTNSQEIIHTRMFTFWSKDNTWRTHDLPMNIVSTTIKLNHANDSEDRRLIALSKEGEVDVFAKGDYVWRTEKIPNAGVRLGSRGAMTHIRQIGKHLFACGHNGQVYFRNGFNSWTSIDSEIFSPTDYFDPNKDLDTRIEDILRSAENQLILNCIDGNNESDIYVVGDAGYMAHFNGKNWVKVDLPTDEHLQWVRCYGRDEVWACGYNGVLLKGNARDGFKNQNHIEDNETWWCLAKYKQDIYLSATSGLYCFSTKDKKSLA